MVLGLDLDYLVMVLTVKTLGVGMCLSLVLAKTVLSIILISFHLNL